MTRLTQCLPTFDIGLGVSSIANGAAAEAAAAPRIFGFFDERIRT